MKPTIRSLKLVVMSSERGLCWGALRTQRPELGLVCAQTRGRFQMGLSFNKQPITQGDRQARETDRGQGDRQGPERQTEARETDRGQGDRQRPGRQTEAGQTDRQGPGRQTGLRVSCAV